MGKIVDELVHSISKMVALLLGIVFIAIAFFVGGLLYETNGVLAVIVFLAALIIGGGLLIYSR